MVCGYIELVRTPIKQSPDPMYAEFEVHRTMIRDRVRTEAFGRAIDSVIRPGDVVLDFGAGSGILSVLAARAGASRVYAIEQTTMAVLAQELAVTNGVDEIIRVIQGNVLDIEPPERVDVIVSEWLGGFGIDEGMLPPLIVARDRWLKPTGAMIPNAVTAWAALVHNRYLEDMVGFLRDNPYGVDFDALIEKTVNEIHYSGSFRHFDASDMRSNAGRLWTTETGLITLEQAEAPHEAAMLLPVQEFGAANAARPLVHRRPRPEYHAVRGPRRPAHSLGNDDCPAELARAAHAGNGCSSQGENRAGSADRDMDELGSCSAGLRLGGARRAGHLGGDRRLSVLHAIPRSLRRGGLRAANRPPTAWFGSSACLGPSVQELRPSRRPGAIS